MLSFLNAPSLAQISDAAISNNAALATVDLPAVTTLGNSLTISDNCALGSISLPKMRQIELFAELIVAGNSGAFDVSDNPLLPNCTAIALRNQVQSAQGIGGTITIRGNDIPRVEEPWDSGGHDIRRPPRDC